MFNKGKIAQIVSKNFPEMITSWAYGSAVFPQSSSSNKVNSNLNMVDLFFVVKDPYVFHLLNFQKNPNHYSGLSYLLGPSYISLINGIVFPIHFNSHVEVQGIKMKYGVVSQQTFLQDLRSWDYLTVAGRLHKPVKFLKGREIFSKELQVNLVSALAYGLVMCQSSSECKLYEQICRLSYLGDVRYSVNLQNRSKVQNIVKHNLQNFQKLYRPMIEKHFKGYVKLEDDKIEMDRSGQGIEYYLSKCILESREDDQLSGKVRQRNRSSSVRMACYHAFSSSLVKNLTYMKQKSKKAQSK